MNTDREMLGAISVRILMSNSTNSNRDPSHVNKEPALKIRYVKNKINSVCDTVNGRGEYRVDVDVDVELLCVLGGKVNILCIKQQLYKHKFGDVSTYALVKERKVKNPYSGQLKIFW